MTNRLLFTISDAAELLSISRKTLGEMVKSKKLPGQSRPKIHFADLEKLIEERKVFG